MPLRKSFSTIFKFVPSLIFYRLIGVGLQPTPNDTEMRKASAIMLRIGSDLLKQSKASHEDDKRNKSSGRKDILSLLPHARPTRSVTNEK
ncbi:hypothetical protein BYT27DRAFT_6513801 [Phlegmacium glaucopus]|nr:hypothetical protein BYT27DRAFT_6513801 [Phlegmacium glaucopus]